MPLRLKSGRVENVSYILDARFSGIPHLAANDGEDDRRHHFVQEEEHVTQDHFRLPRQYPTLDEIIFEGQKESITQFIEALLPFGTTLDGVVAQNAKQEVEARKESTKQSGEPKQPAVFFSYFNQPDYAINNSHNSLFASASYFTSAYHSAATSFKGLFAGYVAPNYINPNYTKRVRHRMRKWKSYKYGVINFSNTLAKYAAHTAHSALSSAYQKIQQYAKTRSNSQQYAQPITPFTNELKKPNLAQVRYLNAQPTSPQYMQPLASSANVMQRPLFAQAQREYSNVAAIPTPHQQERTTTPLSALHTPLTTESARVAMLEINPTLKESRTMNTPNVVSSPSLFMPPTKTGFGEMEMKASSLAPLQSALPRIESTFEYRATRNSYLSASPLPSTTMNLMLPTLPYISTTNASSARTIEQKLERIQRTEQTGGVHQEALVVSMHHKHRSVASIDKLFQTDSFQPASVGRNSALENIIYVPGIEVGITLAPSPSAANSELYKPYITARGETLQNVFKEDIHITKEVLQKAEGKDYLSVAYSELSRLGYKVGIVEQVYKDTKTGKMAKGKMLVLLDRPDLYIEVLVGPTKESTSFLSFYRHGDNPLTESAKNGYATILIKPKDVYVKELDNRFETPKKGKEIERCYAPLPYQKAA